MDSLIINGFDLSSLGITLTRESRLDLLPPRRERSLRIPGRSGAFVFTGRLSSRDVELHLHMEAPDSATLAGRQETLSKILGPAGTELSLIYTDRLDRLYYVRYSGRSSLTQYIDDAIMTIPLKMYDPYIYNPALKQLIGNGAINNQGGEPTPLFIEVEGPATNPQLIIGSRVLQYTGNLAGGQRLVINGKDMLVTIAETNVLPSLTGTLSLLPPGVIQASCSSGIVKWEWRERWLL